MYEKQDISKIAQIGQLISDLGAANRKSYIETPSGYDYDAVIGLLGTALQHIRSGARIPRPAEPLEDYAENQEGEL